MGINTEEDKKMRECSASSFLSSFTGQGRLRDDLIIKGTYVFSVCRAPGFILEQVVC